MDSRCRICGFELWVPIAGLSVSTVGLYDDARFPGRCLVALNEHYDHLEDVPESTASKLMNEMQAVGRALRATLNALHVNYAVLGNTHPHVHAHVIPRYADDPNPLRPPWEHPLPATALSRSQRDRIIGRLRLTLESAGELL